ncbi:zinc finger protein 583-like [Cydia pomonella]|uniref:zinc finger protein 583-like n=1 Tax=Cydia pomonella TaxID=82600 RepID=UPI002ADD64F2|nr:zinc finger protein 583-like [Cydia pomonella]
MTADVTHHSPVPKIKHLVSSDDSEDGSMLIKLETNSDLEAESLEEDCIENIVILRTEGNYKGAKSKNKKSTAEQLIWFDPEITTNRSIILKRTTELDLHLQNLQTIMRCSNATPLRMHGKWYTCCFCPERYEKTAALKRHTVEKHPDGKAAIVGRNISELIIRVDITGLECNLCKTKIGELEKLTKHLKEEHSQRIHTRIKNYMIPFKFDTGNELTCVICEHVFHNFKMLVQHMHVHYPNFVCGSCGNGFVNQRSYQHHASRHANGEHKCEKCKRIFDNDAKLKVHERSVHQGFNKRNKCDFCEERFVGYIAKKAHMIKVHGLPEIQVKCPACEKTFKNHKYLAIHKRTFHMMEKRHKCTECDKMFFSTHEVKQHMLTHTGQRDFQCIICSKSYGRKSTLREHMRIHADDRRFKCEHCGIAFVQKCSWRGHMRSKHGEEV